MKNLIVLLSVLIGSYTANAQKLSLDLYGGLANYQGDLQDKQFTFQESHLAGGLGLSYSLSDHLAIRTAFTVGKLSSDDRFTKNKIRNLNFTSGLTEFQLALQYYLIRLETNRFSPYFFAGVAVYHFNPYTFDTTGTKYYLKPLSTEGQGFVDGKDPYGLTQIAVPIGGGIKFSLNDNINIGVELAFRKLFTDYLDDVSTVYVDKTLLLDNRGLKALELAYRAGELKPYPPYPAAGETRGSPKEDWYYFTAFTFSYRFTDGRGLFGGGGNNGIRSKKSRFSCPANF